MISIFKGILGISSIASFMIIVVSMVRHKVSRRLHSKVMIWLWIMILARLCIPITFTSPIYISNKISNPISTYSMEESITPVHKSPSNVGLKLAKETVKPSSQTKKDTSLSTSISNITERLNKEDNKKSYNGDYIWMLMAIIWVLGLVFILTRTLIATVKFRQKLRLCENVEDKEVLNIVKGHLKDSGIHKDVTIINCPYIGSPSVFGYIKPSILLPDRFTSSINRDRLNSILLHEVFHIKRHDILLSYIWLVAKAIHWFNPLVWMAYRQFKDDVEICCDQMVASRIGEDERLEYSASLIDAARFYKGNIDGAPSISTSFYNNTSKLKERIMRLVKPQKRSNSYWYQ